MSTRRLIRRILLLLCMVFVFALPANATETEGSGPDPNAQVIAKRVSGKYYLYYKDTNKKCTGFTGMQELPRGSKNYYYFKDNKGRIYAGGMFTKNKKTYYAEKNGNLKSGWLTLKGKRYYFYSKTKAQAKGWLKLNKSYYYFNSKGQQVQGWLKLKGKNYYLDPAKKGARAVGWKTLSKKTYYFNTNGQLVKGFLKVGNKRYYMDPRTGVRKTGLLTINGKTYFFNNKNGTMKTSWLTYKGKRYYFSAVSSRYGQAVTGWMKKGGKYYYFDKSGVMQKGWLTVGNRKYYLKPSNGQMATGKLTIGGKTYDFGSKGYISLEPQNATGPWSIKVDRQRNMVAVYRGNTPVKVFLCSTGLNNSTPRGNFSIYRKYSNPHELFGPTWGYYCSEFTTNILFHSLPQSRPGHDAFPVAKYRLLGQQASGGCIRLRMGDAYYIYQNCPVGTPVTVGDYIIPSSVSKPSYKWIPDYLTVDPTDPTDRRNAAYA